MAQTSKLRKYCLGDRVHITAQQFWPILTGFVMWQRKPKHSLITYGELAEKAGYQDGRAGALIGRQLQIIREFCTDNDLPDLTSIVVAQGQCENLSAIQKRTLKYNWYLIGVPTTGMLRKIWEKKS